MVVNSQISKNEIEELIISENKLKNTLNIASNQIIESEKLIEFFTNKKSDDFLKSKIPSRKQIYHLANLLNQLYNSIKSSKNVVLLKRLDNFKYNNYFNQYYLKPRKKFINIKSNLEINIIYNALNNTLNILNTTNNIQDCLKSIKIIDQYFIFKSFQPF